MRSSWFLNDEFRVLNSPNKLVFVRIYGSTITGLVGPLYPYYSLVAFCTVLCFIARIKALTSNN